MNISIRRIQFSLALFSLFALVAAPLIALAAVYGTPITISNPTPEAFYDYFGSSVSIDGNKFIVGALYDDAGATDAGAAYLYDATTGVLLRTFNNPTPAAFDHFGASVAISGNKVLIGADSDDTNATNAGSAYLYDAITGNLIQTFNNPTPAENDHFGFFVSISDDKVLITASSDDTGAINAGAAYLYDATTGALLHTFNDPTPASGDLFGYSAAVSDNLVLIGAALDDTGATDAGSVYLYDSTTGVLLKTFNNPAVPEDVDYFGNSVAISGNNILIGARNDDTNATDAGSAYLFDATTGALLQTFYSPTPAENDHFGLSVSISGDKVLIGESLDDTVTTDSGSVYLYDATTGVLLHTFNNPTPATYEYFGEFIAISGDSILISSSQDGTLAYKAGSVYLYLLQKDTDGDGIADSTDNCPADANADQTDTDADGQGDICDFTPNGDTDGDGVDNLADNCSGIANPRQEDNDGDGIGNVCDPTPDGDPDPNPVIISQCQQLGWMSFGFRNQGQCVVFVNTGNDGRE